MDCLRKFVDPFGMVLVQIVNTGMFLLSKVALDRGVFIYAFLSYRCIIAAICILPFAVIVERKNLKRPTWSVFCWIFLSALLGFTLTLGMYNYGLRDTNATYSASFLNLVPVVTYILAVAARMESLDLNSRAGKMKILGTLVSVGGALVIILYKGKEVHMWPKHIKKAHEIATDQVVVAQHQMRGTLFLIISCLSLAAWYMVQVKVLMVYPFKFMVTMLTCVVGSLQTSILGIILNREKDAWKLQWDLRLLLIMYSADARLKTYKRNACEAPPQRCVRCRLFRRAPQEKRSASVSLRDVSPKRHKRCAFEARLFKHCSSSFLNTAIFSFKLSIMSDNVGSTTLYLQGILSTGAVFCLVSWVVTRRGPTYPNMFNCLALVFTSLLEALFMGQELTVGGLLGMSMIMGGLYAYLWAKEKEKKLPPKESNVADVEIAHGSDNKTDGPKETDCGGDVISK